MSPAKLGLVCITHSPEIRYKTITRTRYLSLEPSIRKPSLEKLYQYNLKMLFKALAFCHSRGIFLYRMLSDAFPLSDFEDGIGHGVLVEMGQQLSKIGPKAEELGVRILAHPDQFVVLNSESPRVVENSIHILENHAFIFDQMDLPQSGWSAINIHGGKGGRGKELVEVVRLLGEGIRHRLTLENDERAFGAGEILEVCQGVEIPMIFDAHHHLVKERLESYEHPSIAHFVQLARQTWNPPQWQVVHISNGREGLLDNRHHGLVETMPSSYRDVEWIEVEAKNKELAIERLQATWLGSEVPA